MTYYIKFLWVAVFCGTFCILGYTIDNETTLLSEIILMLGFNEVDYYPQYMSTITYWYIPILLFQIFYGTYIYRHFCSASVYFFSRRCSRTKWFLKETFMLYSFGLAYLILMILSGVFITSFFSTITMDKAALFVTIYYLLIHSLFLLATTLGINILAIVLTSNVGFILVEGICLFGIASYTIIGDLFAVQDELLNKFVWLLKINPFAHLVFSVHSSGIASVDSMINMKSISFDLNLSVLTYLVVVVILIGCGCMIINNHNFIETNKETGGV